MFWQDSGSETVRSVIQASECGKIRTIHKKTGKITKYPTPIQRGLLIRRVTIAGNIYEVGRLVIGAHGEIPEDGEIPEKDDRNWSIAYADGDKNNVNISNLSWRKIKEEIIIPDGERPVVGIAKDGSISKYESVAIAAKKLGLSAASIRKCLYGTQKRHGNVSWAPGLLNPVVDETGEVWKTKLWSEFYNMMWSSLGRRKLEFEDGVEKLLEPLIIDRANYDDNLSGDFWKMFYGDIPKFHKAIVPNTIAYPISKDMFTLLQTRCEFPEETWKFLEPRWGVLAGGLDDRIYVSTRGRYKIVYKSGKIQMTSSPIGMCLWEIFVGPVPDEYTLFSKTWELDVHSMFLHKRGSGSPYETRRSFNKHTRQWHDVYYH
jgi:hypothetical protein